MSIILSGENGKIHAQNLKKQSYPSPKNGIRQKIDGSLKETSHSC